MTRSSPASMAEIAAAIGVPARAAILTALFGGEAMMAKELAAEAGVAAPTASLHLARLVDAGLLAVDRRGRIARFRLASPAVAHLLEAMLAVATERAPPRWRGDPALRLARTCYDHLAGQLGVALTETLQASGSLVLGADGGEVTPDGARFLTGFGIDMTTLAAGRRRFCRACMDWSERRPHLAGSLGAALAARCFACGWLERRHGSRAVAISPEGERGLAAVFGVEVSALRAASRATPRSAPPPAAAPR